MNNNNNNNNTTITNIMNNANNVLNNMKNKQPNKVNNSPPSKNNIEKCKTIMQSVQIMPMFSPKNIVVGSIGTFIPWVILLIIVGIIIII
jgi:ribonuclease D